MEFVVVSFPRPRQVVVDDAPQGVTGQIIRVQAGLHRFDLGVPPDYTPAIQSVVVGGTTKATPMLIAFEEMFMAAEAPTVRAGRAEVPAVVEVVEVEVVAVGRSRPRKRPSSPGRAKARTRVGRKAKATAQVKRAGKKKAARKAKPKGKGRAKHPREK